MMASTSTAPAAASFLPNPVPSAEPDNEPEYRISLNGAWILDKTPRPNEDWSMKHYLAVMNVDPLAIEAHDKGEMQHDTIHTIYMDHRQLHIIKRSRVNNNVKVALEFGRLHVEYLPPGNREKSSMVTTLPNEFGKKFQIQSTLQTVNGKAHITDIRELLVVQGVDCGDGSRITRTFMLQTLTIVNQQTGQQSTTKRYFLPYNDVAAAAAATAAGAVGAPPPPPITTMNTSSMILPNNAMSMSSSDTATLLQGLGQPARPAAATSMKQETGQHNANNNIMSTSGPRASPTSGSGGGSSGISASHPHHHFGGSSSCINGVAAIRYYLDCMMEMDKTSGMKAFLLDAATTQIVSAVYSQTEILNKQVYLVTRLDKQTNNNNNSSSDGSNNNNNNAHLKALCFCRPTAANIELLCRELERPRFCEYHLFFSGILTSGWLRLLAEADAGAHHHLQSSQSQQQPPRVVQVQEMYADFLPLNTDFWSLQSRNTLPMTVAAGTSWAPKYAMQYERNLQGLQSMLLALKRQPSMIRYAGSSPCAEELARDIHDAIQADEIFHFRQRPSNISSSSSSSGGLLLLVLDRRDDPVTPLLSQWTYQAMVHELLGLNNHRVILRGAPNNVAPDLQEVVLSSSADAFFAQHKHDNFGQLGEAIQKLLQDYQRTTAQHANVANLNSLQEMQAFLDKFPEVKSQSHIVSKHVAIMGELARLVEVCSLLDVSQFEQELACETGIVVGVAGVGAASKHDAHWRELMQKLESPAVKVPDKLRLGLLYALRYETTGNLHMVQSAMTKNGVPAEMVQLIPLLLRYGGQKSRGPGLYSGGVLSGESSNMLSKMTKSFMTSVQGIDNVYAQHVPLVMDTIQAVLKGKLSSKTHPIVYDANAARANAARLRRSGSGGNGSSHGRSASSGAIGGGEGLIPQEILIFMVGGITYEEGTKIYELNETLKPRGIQIVLAGSTVHNSTSFLDELKTTAL